MKCYKLVFDINYFKKNIVSIIVLIILIIDILFVICYFLKGISPLRLELSKFLFKENEIKNSNDDDIKIVNINVKKENSVKELDKKKINNRKKIETDNIKEDTKASLKKGPKSTKPKKNKLYPPKKKQKKSVRINSAEKKKKEGKLNLPDIITKKIKARNIKRRRSIKNKKNDKVPFDVESLKSDKVVRRKSIIDYQKEREVRLRKNKMMIESSDNILIPKESEKKKLKNIIKNDNTDKINNNQNDKLDDYELNNLNYSEAITLDKRDFCETYYSLLKRAQLFLFTFISQNNYNLFYVKIVRFIFVLLTIMTTNAFLFSDKSIHKLFVNGVRYRFINQYLQIILSVIILQIILSVIIVYIFDILLFYLSLSDKSVYEIKAMPKEQVTGVKIFIILKRMRIKLILFLIFSLIVMLFYWYFISAFCSVYNNSQIIYIIDCVISFAFFNAIPFILYALVTLLRIISLKKKVKKLYNICKMLPIF